MSVDAPLPDDVEALKAMLLAEREAYRAELREQALRIEQLKQRIAKLQHERFGQSSERRALLEQLELQLFELEEDQAQAETRLEIAASPGVAVQPFTRRKPARRPLPDHLPRERVVYPVPPACPCCGGGLHKLGEDVTESLELVPRQWKVIQHVREKFPAAPARRSRSRRRRAIRSPVAAPAQVCWPWCWSRSTGTTSRSTGRARSTPGKASRSTSRPWRIGSGPSARPRCHWSWRSNAMSSVSVRRGPQR